LRARWVPASGPARELYVTREEVIQRTSSLACASFARHPGTKRGGARAEIAERVVRKGQNVGGCGCQQGDLHLFLSTLQQPGSRGRGIARVSQTVASEFSPRGRRPSNGPFGRARHIHAACTARVR